MNMIQLKLNTKEKKYCFLAGLIFKCPYSENEDNPVGCHLHELRKKLIQERIDHIKSLTEGEMDGLLHKHLNCDRNRP